MKLESTLPNRVGPLHLVPMLDTVMLLLIFVLIGGSFVLHSGINVDVPVSNSLFRSRSGAAVVTVAADMGKGPRLMLNGKDITLEELDEALKNARTEGRQLILRADYKASWGLGIRIISMAENYGYEVAISTKSADAL